MLQDKALITLAQAKQVVLLLEAENIVAANEIIHSITLEDSAELFSEVGKLTRQVHNSLSTFHLDDRITSITAAHIPDVKSRLEFVIEETEKAANSTMDAVDRIMPTADKLSDQLASIMPEWKKLMSRQFEPGEFKQLCLALDQLLLDANNESKILSSSLSEVVLAQGFQDITGQVIRRVIEIMKEVEDHLVDMLATFGDPEYQNLMPQPLVIGKKCQKEKAEGPIINAANRDDVVTGQDDVDDLLSSLGF